MIDMIQDTGERLIPEGNTKSLTYGEHLSRYMSVLDAVKGKVVLDVASGAGYGTNLIASKAKFVTGVDYSKDAIEYSQNLYKSKNLEFICGDAQNLPIKDKSVDVVISLETIEHLKEPEQFVKEVKRVLKPGGKFIVSTPNDDEYIEGNEFHLHEFHLDELKMLIKKHFKSANYYYQGSFFSAGVYDIEFFQQGGVTEGEFAKTFGQDVNKAIYFIASASDSSPAELTSTTVVSDAWNTKDDIERAKGQEAHIASQAKELTHAQSEVTRLVNEITELGKRLYEIESSRSWTVIQKLHAARSKFRR